MHRQAGTGKDEQEIVSEISKDHLEGVSSNEECTLTPYKDPVNVFQSVWKSRQVEQGSGVFGVRGAKEYSSASKGLSSRKEEMSGVSRKSEGVSSNDYDMGIKYCPGLEVNLPYYEYEEYKPRFSSKPYIFFGVGPCEEEPEGGGGRVQADRQDEEDGPGGNDEEFVQTNVRNLISAWETLELGGGEEDELTLPGGQEDRGGGRRKSQAFRDICKRFGGLGDGPSDQTDRQEVSFVKTCSFSDVASKLLGPHFGGRVTRKKLQFSLSSSRQDPIPATDNGTTGLASPSANHKRALDMVGGQTGAKRLRAGDIVQNTINSDNTAEY